MKLKKKKPIDYTIVSKRKLMLRDTNIQKNIVTLNRLIIKIL